MPASALDHPYRSKIGLPYTGRRVILSRRSTGTRPKIWGTLSEEREVLFMPFLAGVRGIFSDHRDHVGLFLMAGLYSGWGCIRQNP